MNKLFASAAVKNTTKVQKLVELHGIRNLFGRLLYISTLERIDIEKVFKYLLTPMPLELSHILPVFHAFAGTNVTASVMSKAIQRPLNNVVKYRQFISEFAMFGEH
ncbi:hypothetical protein LSH36_1459g00001 [Paralvinella palmiformis]|uniref:Uncharacterized protein n=1 Tax=Paralvinella palmiformis TaxID=53620 RepID=A0AAD9ITU1_9ANNE|nr:hypothetical protein LSH36_1459g00001 [Paralvinella palmiformis]